MKLFLALKSPFVFHAKSMTLEFLSLVRNTFWRTRPPRSEKSTLLREVSVFNVYTCDVRNLLKTQYTQPPKQSSSTHIKPAMICYLNPRA